MQYPRIFIFALNLRSYELKHRKMIPEVQAGALALATKYRRRGQQVQICWCTSSGEPDDFDGEVNFSQAGEEIGIYVVCEADTTAIVATDAFVKTMLQVVGASEAGQRAVWRYLCLVACHGYNTGRRSQSPIGQLAHHLRNNGRTPDLAAFDNNVSILYEGMSAGHSHASDLRDEAFQHLNVGRKIEVVSGGQWNTRHSRSEANKAKHKFKWSYDEDSNQYLQQVGRHRGHDLDLGIGMEDNAPVNFMDLMLEITPIQIQPMAGPRWVPDHERPRCSFCNVEFGFLTRRHHCRGCGEIFCKNCSSKTKSLQNPAKEKADSNENGPYRVCDACHRNPSL